MHRRFSDGFGTRYKIYLCWCFVGFCFSVEKLLFALYSPSLIIFKGLRSRGGRLKEDHIAYILHETLKGLIHLHDNHCMHR